MNHIELTITSTKKWRNHPSGDLFFFCLGLLLPHVLLYFGHFFSLPLTTSVSAQPLLAKLQSSFVLVQFQQLHASLLVRSESCHISHQVTHERRFHGVFL